MEENRRFEEIIIDVGTIETSEELHNILKDRLFFPSYYGKNWDAFWDTVTSLVLLPKSIVFENWKNLEKNLPEDSLMLMKILKDLSNKYPDWSTNVVFV